MNADEARTVIKTLGEFVEARYRGDGLMMLTFVKYDTSARSGKFHQYKHLSVPVVAYEEIKHELK